jgi:hypothetical protein
MLNRFYAVLPGGGTGAARYVSQLNLHRGWWCDSFRLYGFRILSGSPIHVPLFIQSMVAFS